MLRILTNQYSSKSSFQYFSVSGCKSFSTQYLRIILLLAVGTALAGCKPFARSEAVDDLYKNAETGLGLTFASAGGDPAHEVNRGAKTGLLPAGASLSSGVSLSQTASQYSSSDEALSSATPQTLASVSQDVAARLPSALDPLVTEAVRARGKTAARTLDRFYAALRELEAGTRSKPVTILHLGGDHVAFDRFASVIRARLQTQFGDAGRGTILPGFAFPYYRANGLHFAKSGTWKPSSVLSPGKTDAFGLTGVAMTSASAGASLSVEQKGKLFDWAEVELAAGRKESWAIVSVDGPKGRSKKVLSPMSGLSGANNVVRVRLDHPGTKLRIEADGKGPIKVLSWRLGNNQPGIRYINFGLPGISANALTRFDQSIVSEELAHLQPDLIILNYGTHDGMTDSLSLAGFARQMGTFVDQLKASAPAASLLIVGPPDAAIMPKFAKESLNSTSGAACRQLTAEERGIYKNLIETQHDRLARWYPPLKLSPVRQTLSSLARINGAYFWDWSKVMGGPCGIHGWVHTNPPLAAPNHVHLTEAGAEVSANAFLNDLLTGYAALRTAEQTGQVTN